MRLALALLLGCSHAAPLPHDPYACADRDALASELEVCTANLAAANEQLKTALAEAVANEQAARAEAARLRVPLRRCSK